MTDDLTATARWTTTDKWLVMAAVCTCSKVAMSILEEAKCDKTIAPVPEGDWEMVTAGPDWEPLVEQLAPAMAGRTGLPISGCCTSVYVRDQRLEDEISDAASALLYRLRDTA